MSMRGGDRIVLTWLSMPLIVSGLGFIFRRILRDK